MDDIRYYNKKNTADLMPFDIHNAVYQYPSSADIYNKGLNKAEFWANIENGGYPSSLVHAIDMMYRLGDTNKMYNKIRKDIKNIYPNTTPIYNNKFYQDLINTIFRDNNLGG